MAPQRFLRFGLLASGFGVLAALAPIAPKVVPLWRRPGLLAAAASLLVGTTAGLVYLRSPEAGRVPALQEAPKAAPKPVEVPAPVAPKALPAPTPARPKAVLAPSPEEVVRRNVQAMTQAQETPRAEAPGRPRWPCLRRWPASRPMRRPRPKRPRTARELPPAVCPEV